MKRDGSIEADYKERARIKRRAMLGKRITFTPEEARVLLAEKPKRLRVFPRRTKATPDDSGVRIGTPELFDEADEIDISVTFTWDRAEGEALEKQWRHIGTVQLGGPAYGDSRNGFTPGEYLKPGYVITSRGCNNRCSFCMAWRREGTLHELPIVEGYNVLDNNLLQCSESHIRAVFAMLRRQPERARFTGGLESALLLDWHVAELATLKPKLIYLAYDEPRDYEPLRKAAEMLDEAGLVTSGHAVRAYVLCGYPDDSIESATRRMDETCALGIMPMAMLYRGEDGALPMRDWQRFQREWARPSIIGAKMKGVSCEKS